MDLNWKTEATNQKKFWNNHNDHTFRSILNKFFGPWVFAHPEGATTALYNTLVVLYFVDLPTIIGPAAADIADNVEANAMAYEHCINKKNQQIFVENAIVGGHTLYLCEKASIKCFDIGSSDFRERKHHNASRLPISNSTVPSKDHHTLLQFYAACWTPTVALNNLCARNYPNDHCTQKYLWWWNLWNESSAQGALYWCRDMG